MAEAAIRKVEPVEVETPPAPQSKDVRVPLEEPVQAHGEPVKVMIFRKPTGADMMTIEKGWPVDIDWPTGKVMPNPAIMAQVMSTLAQVPPSTIKMLAGKDFTNCAFALMGFFTPGSPATQS